MKIFSYAALDEIPMKTALVQLGASELVCADGGVQVSDDDGRAQEMTNRHWRA